jgi:hypothetical protein
VPQGESPRSPGFIEVIRDHQIFLGLLSFGWRVFVDGVWRGDVDRTTPVRLEVASGHHAVKVWTHRGRAESNEVELEVESGEVLHLRCRCLAPPVGISKLPQQIDTIRTGLKTGATQALELYEDGAFPL